MKYKDLNYEHISIGFMPNDLIWISGLASINGRTLGIWLQAMLIILSRDNMMPLDELTSKLCGHNIPRREVKRLLLECGCFESDDGGQHIWCSEQTLQLFLITPTEGATEEKSLARGLAAKETPTGVAPASALPTRDKKKEKKKKELTLLKRKSFAELSSAAVTAEEKAFYQELQTHCPHVCQMEQPLAYPQYQHLLTHGYTQELIRDTLEAMENHKRLLSDYNSAYLTLRSWMNLRLKHAKQ